MAGYPLEPKDGAVRVALPEREWRHLAPALGDLRLPAFFAPGPEPARMPETSADDPLVDLDDLDPATREALRLSDHAVVEAHLQVAVGGNGVAVAAWTDGRTASGLRRALEIRHSQPYVRPGVEVSGLMVERFVDELLRYFVDRPIPPGVAAVTLPLETSHALGMAVKEGRLDDVRLLLDDADLPELPPLIRALTTQIEGDLVLSVTGAAGTSGIRLVLTQVGWVELQRTRDDQIVHTPYDRDGLQRLVTSAVVAQFDAFEQGRRTWSGDAAGDQATDDGTGEDA